MLMTGNVKLCCMVLPRLGVVLRVANSSVLSCPVAFGKTVMVVYYQVACWLVPFVFMVSLFVP